MNSAEQNKQIIKRYKSPFSFYALSSIIPWSLWFISAWFSHQEPYTPAIEWATGITSFAGLLAPVIIALFFILRTKELAILQNQQEYSTAGSLSYHCRIFQ